MKLAITWIALVAIAILSVGSCSIQHRSGPFECETTPDCDDGRVCNDGLCVVPGGAPKDAAVGVDAPTDAPLPIDAAACPMQCTSCNQATKECTIDCAMSPMGCVQQVVCPTGWDCSVKCTTPGSCRNGVDCQGSTGCTVACTGSNSCRNVQCGPGECDVACTGQDSCRGVSCGPSCACDVSCSPGADCVFVNCTEPLCDIGRGCASAIPGCDECP